MCRIEGVVALLSGCVSACMCRIEGVVALLSGCVSACMCRIEGVVAGIMVWICAVGLSSIYIYCTMNALRLHERYVCTCPRVYILYLSASRAFRSSGCAIELVLLMHGSALCLYESSVFTQVCD